MRTLIWHILIVTLMFVEIIVSMKELRDHSMHAYA